MYIKLFLNKKTLKFLNRSLDVILINKIKNHQINTSIVWFSLRFVITILSSLNVKSKSSPKTPYLTMQFSKLPNPFHLEERTTFEVSPTFPVIIVKLNVYPYYSND